MNLENERKRLRRQYQRAWVAEKRARTVSILHNTSSHHIFGDDSSSDDSTHLVAEKQTLVREKQFNQHKLNATHSPVDTAESPVKGGLHKSSSNDDVDAENRHSDTGDAVWDEIDHHFASSSEFEDSMEHEDSLEDRLSSWATEFQVKHNALDSLLKLLKQHNHSDLPSSARILLKTLTSVTTKTVSGMQYFYFGLKAQLQKEYNCYSKNVQENLNVLELSFNVDGLPLFKSSSMTLWPILCSVVNTESQHVFPVALTLGKSKPTNLDFLSETIEDLTLLMTDGLECCDRRLNITVRCIVCDAPAKVFVKKMKQFSGYYGCDKCCEHGTWVGEGGKGRVTYQNVCDIVPRTDDAFRNQSQEEHHTGLSPFCQLPVDMIDSFPIDYMHQVCLGTMKRIILGWMRGPSRNVRLSANHINQISERLLLLKTHIPGCFARKPRSLMEVDRWKATEYRQFLLYTGKVVLKDIIPKEFYQHFLCFSFATSLFVCPHTAERDHFRKYAQELLEDCVAKGRQLYGSQFLVYNVHSLLHLSREAEIHGSLDKCSAFAFENYLQKLKRLVRSIRNPIAQIVKRLSEIDAKQVPDKIIPNKLSAKRPNNAFILGHHSCCEVLDKHGNNELGEQQYLCRVYRRASALFDNPSDSKIIGAYRVHENNAHLKVFSSEIIQRGTQAILIPTEGSHTLVFLAVLHQYHS